MREGTGSAANANLALLFSFLLKLTPYALSAMLMYLGYDLYLRGVSGQAALLPTEPVELQDQLINATPGLLAGVGGFVALVLSIIKSSYDDGFRR